MPWARLDDNLNSHPKFTALTGDAFRLWAAGAVYCAKALSDGFMPAYEVENFPLRGGKRKVAIKQLLVSLVPGKGPLWHEAQQDGVDGFLMHDYLDHNDSRAVVLAKREANVERVGNWRKKKREYAKPLNADQAEDGNALRNGVRNALPNSVQNAVRNTPTTYHVPQPREQQDAELPAPRGTSENQNQRADDRAPVRKRLSTAEKRLLPAAFHKTLDVSPDLDDDGLKTAVGKLLKIGHADDAELQAIVDAVRAERTPKARSEQSVSPLMRDTLRLAGIDTDEIFAKFYGATFAPDPMTGHAVLVMPTQESRDAIDYGLAMEIRHAFTKAAKSGLKLKGIVVAPPADEHLHGYQLTIPQDDVLHLCELAGIKRFFIGTVFDGAVLGHDDGDGLRLSLRSNAFEFVDRQFAAELIEAARTHLGQALEIVAQDHPAAVSA